MLGMLPMMPHLESFLFDVIPAAQAFSLRSTAATGDLPRWYVLFIAVPFILVEILWSQWRHKNIYVLPEFMTNLGILIGSKVTKGFVLSYQAFCFAWVGQWALVHLPMSLAVFLLTFIGTEFCYYVHHRISHEVKFFWAFHLIHHSSPWFNLTTSYRLHWFGGLTSIIFYLPLVFLGLPPLFIAASLGISLLYQFFLHTQAIPRLGILEGLINTPSAHRVHHGANPEYIDKNYGGILMIWDRLFGTYAPETVSPVYGITTGFVSHNPFVLLFHGFKDILRGQMASKG
jgi:sterol desaturase/sphingolipid hydroxylase (fatty acid hydroxylase superfamily)